MIRGILVLAMATAALPAAAQTVACRFATECFENEPCAASDFVLRVRPGVEPMSVHLAGPVETVIGQLGVAQGGATVVLARSASSLQILTIGLNDTARYSLHLTEGPAMISYIGTCEEE